MQKKTLRTLVYSLIIGGCAAFALTFFTISQFEKAKYQASETVKLSSKSRLDSYIAKDAKALENESSEYHQYAVYWNGIYNDFIKISEDNAAKYIGTAIPAYTFSMATLVAFGLVLKHAEKTKEKEEKEV